VGAKFSTIAWVLCGSENKWVGPAYSGFHVIRTLLWTLPAIMFYRCSFDLLSHFFLSPPISEVAWPIITKLCHTFNGDPDLWNLVRHLEAPSLRNMAAQRTQILARFRTTSWLDCEYLRNATRYRLSENGTTNYEHPAQANLIRCILVHRWRKIGPEFWPNHRW